MGLQSILVFMKSILLEIITIEMIDIIAMKIATLITGLSVCAKVDENCLIDEVVADLNVTRMNVIKSIRNVTSRIIIIILLRFISFFSFFFKFFVVSLGMLCHALRHLILIQNDLYIYYFSKTLEGFSGAKGKINEHELGLRIGFAYTKG